jgi:hypothetical protein
MASAFADVHSHRQITLVRNGASGGRTVEEVRVDAMAAQSIKAMISPKDIAALAVFLASDAGKSISGQVLPIDNDRQRA